MAKKKDYNQNSREELTKELTSLRASLRAALLEKMKSGKAKEYRTTRKTIARVLTALNAKAE